MSGVYFIADESRNRMFLVQQATTGYAGQISSASATTTSSLREILAAWYSPLIWETQTDRIYSSKKIPCISSGLPLQSRDMYVYCYDIVTGAGSRALLPVVLTRFMSSIRPEELLTLKEGDIFTSVQQLYYDGGFYKKTGDSYIIDCHVLNWI